MNRECVFVFLFLFFAVSGVCGSNQTRDGGGGGGNDEGGGGGHHGVRLASWRWSEYSTVLTFTTMVIVAGVLKLAFHHTHFLSK